MNIDGLVAALVIALATLTPAVIANAQSEKTPAAVEIDRDVDDALRRLRAMPAAKTVAAKAHAVLVFPEILKGGLLVGAQYGKGSLRKKGGKTLAYYETVSASYGLQAGVQKYGYALLFMNEKALAYLDHSDGWEVGVGPSVVIVDAALARSLTSTTLKNDVYAFVFDQSGLMAGLGLQGSKITKINP